MLADVSVVSWPTCRWCVGGVLTDALADVLADASLGSDSLPLPVQFSSTEVDYSRREQPHDQAKFVTLFLMLHNRFYSVCYRKSTTG